MFITSLMNSEPTLFSELRHFTTEMEQKSHVAILPSPGMGHFIPMVEFAKRLTLHHNLYVTLIIPDPGPHFNHELRTILESLPGGCMKYILLPQPNFDDFESHLEFKVRSVFTVARSLPSIRDVIKSLVATTANLEAMVVDLFGTEAFDVANEFNVPAYMFFPSNATALSMFLHLPKVDATVSCQYKDLPQPFQIPGCRIPLRGKDFPEPIQDRQSISYKLFLSTVKRYGMAQGIILNSFIEMEAGVIETLQEKQLIEMPPLFPVGPLVRSEYSNSTNVSEIEDLEYSTMMKWLDDQPFGSVLFICLGTLGSLSHVQLIELAFGLEMSEKSFLWVVRNPNEQNISNPNYDQPLTFLPEGFIERTSSQGFLVSNWVPQARVLGHGSTGGFLTHCGWNSVLESVWNGIPMIAWPLVSEQKLNAVMLSEDLKVALRPETDNENGLVGRVAIANAIKNLMEGEKRKQLEMRLRELKDAAANVLSEDGSSTKSLANLVSKWKKI